jgi:hypothetical protein
MIALNIFLILGMLLIAFLVMYYFPKIMNFLDSRSK